MTDRPAPPKAVDIVRAFTRRWATTTSRFIDWGEPACFACGYYQPRWTALSPWHEPTDGPTPDSVLNERWEKSRLQKAHLIPHSLGGSNEPNNYAMLCRRCHRDAPDTSDGAAMVRWIARRETYNATLANEFIGFCAKDLARRWVAAGRPDPDFESVMGRAIAHFDPSDGAGMSLATLAAVAVDAVEAAVAKQLPGQLRLL